MAQKHTRFLFGRTLVDKIDVKKFAKFYTASAPTAEKGVLYFNGSNFLGCVDGTNWVTIQTS